MTIHYREQGQSIVVFGNTFPIKDRIKALGGRFNGREKNWSIPLSEKNLEAMKNLCNPQAAETVDVKPGLIARAASSESTLKPEDGLSIAQLMDRINMSISSAFPTPIWVVGEVQNLAMRSNGAFFDLAEGQSGGHENATTTARAILWQSSKSYIEKSRGADKLKDVLADGMRIRCLVQVSLYRNRGQVSLSVEDIDPNFTKGALALAREKLLRELRAKGLDQAQKLLDVPAFPFKIGLITAEGSRAKSDFEDQLYSGGFPGDIITIPTPMQGEKVPERVVEAIARLEKEGVDLIVLTRGGGSAADLRWFDASELAYAIADCKTPMVCAIGHHDDQCVAEEIAHTRQKTPTAAAEFVLSIFKETSAFIDKLSEQMASLLSRRVEDAVELQNALLDRLLNAAERSLASKRERLLQTFYGLSHVMQERIVAGRQALERLLVGIFRSADQGLTAKEKRVAELETVLAKKDPSPWLAAGWTQLWNDQGVLLGVDQTKIGDQVKARLKDGLLDLTIKSINEVQHGKGKGV